MRARSFQTIGMRVSLSAPAVKRRVDRLEADGVIRGYTAVVDPGRDGLAHARAVVALFCEGRMAAAEVREAVEPTTPRSRPPTRSPARRARSCTCARATRRTSRRRSSASATRPGIIRTQTQVVLSTLFERPVAG